MDKAEQDDIITEYDKQRIKWNATAKNELDYLCDPEHGFSRRPYWCKWVFRGYFTDRNEIFTWKSDNEDTFTELLQKLKAQCTDKSCFIILNNRREVIYEWCYGHGRLSRGYYIPDYTMDILWRNGYCHKPQNRW